MTDKDKHYIIVSRQLISYLETDSLIASILTKFNEKIRYLLASNMQFF